MIKYPLDKNKPTRTDWENLKEGDFVFTESFNGLTSASGAYGVGELVVKITARQIITEDDSGNQTKWNRKYREGFAYYLNYFQSN